MLVKNQDLSLLNSSDVMLKRTYLTEKKTKRKEYYSYGEFKSQWERVEWKSGTRPEKFMILEMFGYRMAKFYLTMDQEIQVCFMINLKILT